MPVARQQTIAALLEERRCSACEKSNGGYSRRTCRVQEIRREIQYASRAQNRVVMRPVQRPVGFRKYVRPQLALRNNHSIPLPASRVF
jgi:hypothetical protein